MPVLADYAHEVVTVKDVLIVREGETGNCLFLLGVGLIDVWKHFGKRSPTHQGTHLATLGPAILGEMCIL